MIYYPHAAIEQVSVHFCGNKMNDEKLRLSENPLELQDEILPKILLQYFLSAFEKVNEVYRFSHTSGDLHLNEVYHFATAIFEDASTFHENSKLIARHLYEVAQHPKIKSGELYITLFSNVQMEGIEAPAIGIFKSESKETYLKVSAAAKGFDMQYEEEAINIKKLDKGCLIFKHEEEEGFRVAVVDANKTAETVYWVDQFLQLKILNNDYHQTNNALTICKEFVTGKMEEVYDISKTQKIDMLNRSIKYFKEKETFDLDEFSNEVIGDERGIASFREYKRNFEDEADTSIPDNFSIAIQAVKKQARNYKSVLKLDRNFHIYIHGNNELIEKGFDESKNLNFYKVFFREEQ
jgi:37-kD nucleoid-associated bacterial protein